MTTPNKHDIFLNYSDLVKGKHCPRALWFNKHRPDLKAPKETARLLIVEEEKVVKSVAASRFPQAIQLGTSTKTSAEHVIETQKALKRDMPFLVNALFQIENRFIRCDMLQKTEDGWTVYAVKSSNRVKRGHIDELAYCVEGLSHFDIVPTTIFLMTLNPDYVRKGELNIKKVLKRHRLTRRVKARVKTIPPRLASSEVILSQPNAPTIEISPHCLSPYPCDFQSTCWSHIEFPSIFDISGMAKKKKFSLYEKGYYRLEDLPTSTPLTVAQKLQTQALLDAFTHINHDQIKTFLKPIKYPVYHLDFEAVQHNIPRFEGTKCYQAVPFQFSLHIQQKPNGPTEHIEFIAPPTEDPRPAIARELVKFIPKKSTVVVFNAHFETTVLSQLADLFPDYASHLLSLTRNIVDIMLPFQHFHYYAPIMRGSHSIKAVLPALVPEFSYSDLAISNGEVAAKEYAQLFDNPDPDAFNRLKADFLAYCKLDTLAMVKVLDKLWDVSH